MAKRRRVGKQAAAGSGRATGRPAGKKLRAASKAKPSTKVKASANAKAPSARAAALSSPGRRWPMFQVDAFASRLFTGNPAAVVLLEDRWLSDETMLAIAGENNLAETAFLLAKARTLHLRWFTPALEMDLCGHATLATAHVLIEHVGLKFDRIEFQTRSGPLGVERLSDGLLSLDLPSRPAEPVPISNQICAALGRAPVECLQARDLMCVFDNRRDVYELKPDMARLAELDAFGVIVTAPGSGHDFVSRFFAPKAGVPEDPVTGSAHCTLVPYWSDRLHKPRLRAHQVSKRGGELWCEDRGTRVRIAGRAVTFLEGAIRA
jgi:PhzF family phenazine biosynthesis protein